MDSTTILLIILVVVSFARIDQLERQRDLLLWFLELTQGIIETLGSKIAVGMSDAERPHEVDIILGIDPALVKVSAIEEFGTLAKWAEANVRIVPVFERRIAKVHAPQYGIEFAYTITEQKPRQERPMKPARDLVEVLKSSNNAQKTNIKKARRTKGKGDIHPHSLR